MEEIAHGEGRRKELKMKKENQETVLQEPKWEGPVNNDKTTQRLHLLNVSYTQFSFSIPVASAPIDEIIQLLLFVSQAVSGSSIHPSLLSELSSEHISSCVVFFSCPVT